MISILGCGWLGYPLAKSFLKNNRKVYGSTTTFTKLCKLKNAGILPFLINLEDKPAIDLFLQNKILLINIPPGRNSRSNYLKRLQYLKEQIRNSPVSKIIFVSTTAIYSDTEQGFITETSPLCKSEKAQILFEAEELFRKIDWVSTTVIRFAGLIGPGRHPGRFFRGKSELENGLAPVNLVHLDDCIELINKIINHNYWDQTINLAAPSHPTKMDFYDKATKLYGGLVPLFKAEKLSNKIISSEKAVKELNFKFKHSDLMACLETI